MRIVVLDEADEMADMGFLPPIKRILKQIRPDAQHMLFSATLDHGVDEVVSEFLHDPKVHSVDEVTSNVDSMTHHLFLVSRNDKAAVVRELASGRGRRILFTRTKFHTKKLAHTLTQSGIPAAELHGNLSQHQRDRNLQAFESGQVNVLVATDVAARGIDVSNVGLVVQVEPPEDPKSFTHRSGRTARAGQSGDVVTLMTPDQKRKIRHLFKEVDIKLKPVEVTPESPQVQELVGQKADPVHGWELPELERKPRKSNGGRKSRRDRGRTNRDEEQGSRSARGGRRTCKGEHRPTERERQIAKEQQEFAALFLGDVSSDNPRYSEPAESEQASRHERDRRRDERPRNRRERRAEQFGEAGDDRDYRKSRQNRNNGKKRIERRHARREEEREERRGGKRIHHHDNDRLFDARDESVKRHERRLEVREQTRTAPKRARKSGKHSQFKNKGKRRNDNPFRGGRGRR